MQYTVQTTMAMNFNELKSHGNTVSVSCREPIIWPFFCLRVWWYGMDLHLLRKVYQYFINTFQSQ